MKGKSTSIEAGKRFGSLVVQQRPQKTLLRNHQNLCLCDCRKALIVTSHMLLTGKTTHCGCIDRGRHTNAMYPERIKGLDNLADAIMKRAAIDYRQAVMQNLKNGSYGELMELRRFFKSDWGKSLTDVNTDVLMNRIEQECIIEFEKRKKKKK